VEHLVFGLYLCLTAFVFARLEIEIEGPNGWAANLPTWRISNKWTQILYSGRPLTGYHLWMQIFILLLVHLPVAMRYSLWSWALELQLIGFFIWFLILEDFLWFVFNPSFGVKRFRRENIWWHAPNWWWIMPRDYWVYGTLGVAVYVVGCRMR
jgi:hypothetical protein